ncbi:MAG: protein-L-isoaspartate(D-aspartate) O-methyltransferase [Planctomycetes bacterium]|nr:protein-L-isoaspartate(D-aspartate) O-methyltransferase [Planctomycetota bacterium]MBI3844535.1 protein-L-isoaspartate(D-aspartate) O-methyltransferase [Planctomycetota bacterium]
MVEQQLISRGIRDGRVVHAVLKVPRHVFVPGRSLDDAYADRPLPIGEDQTISQPYIVAHMTELLEIPSGAKVLEIGTGSGYQTAVLAELAATVVTVERHAALSAAARARLEALGYSNVHCCVGDGTLGWEAAAPFDRILVTAGAPSVPERVLGQLATDGGMLVLPLGTGKILDLVRVVRHGNDFRSEVHGKCSFVKLIGEFGWPDERESTSSEDA